ncbi:MAG: hypothetical protein U5K81_06795 [Trueperaceae bacterium]|nr:hypothetical protein [Trueperaceae bacterium]
MTLLRMRLAALRNAVRHRPVRHLAALAAVTLAGWGILAATRRGVRFVDDFPAIGTIADAVLMRSLEGLFTVLMLGVAFSVLTSAVTTLYASQDLPLLLSLPVPPARVFALKTVEVFAGSAMIPALLTAPAVLGLGLERGAPAAYYPVALTAVLALYALPVALGALASLLLVRAAPPGRAAEVATAANVVLAAGLVLGLRALRPERLQAMDPDEFERMLEGFARLEFLWAPPAWASRATWSALEGSASPWLFGLLGVAAASLWGVSRVAAFAYRSGWIRGLDSVRAVRDPRPRPPPAWERPLHRLGPIGSLWVKDLRLTARDPTQWSQLLVLLALAGVYLLSTASLDVGQQRFRDALGTMNLAFVAFLLVGVGVRTAFPLVSLEGEGWWLVRTAPISTGRLVAAKFLQALPPMLALGLAVGAGAAWLLDLSPPLAAVSPWAGAGAALAACGLGVGLGAAWPRFDAASPAEVPLTPGGLVYMGAGMSYALAQTVILAWPAWQVLRTPGAPVWRTPEGMLAAGLAAALTLAVTALPLVFGARALARVELGD